MAKQPFAAAVKVTVIGVLGGSGLYEPSFFESTREKKVKTPFGDPSDHLKIGEFDGLRVVFIPRHGRKHTIPANLVNHEAYIWAWKKEGVSHIVSSSSVGSLKRSIEPGHFVVPDDFFCFWSVPTVSVDVHHATPEFDEDLRRVLKRAAETTGGRTHDGGTYVQTLGPRLETKAEIRFFKDYGEILGMTMAAEATIACDLEIGYASLCMVDNYCNGIVPKVLTYAHIVRQQKVNSVRLIRAMKAAVRMLA